MVMGAMKQNWKDVSAVEKAQRDPEVAPDPEGGLDVETKGMINQAIGKVLTLGETFLQSGGMAGAGLAAMIKKSPEFQGLMANGQAFYEFYQLCLITPGIGAEKIKPLLSKLDIDPPPNLDTGEAETDTSAHRG